jgi:DNA-directed RNA polymerase-5 subunit 1
MQCFRKSAEKVDSDQLASVVSTCSWGNHAAVGTGSAFKNHWNDENQVIWPFHLSMLFLLHSTKSSTISHLLWTHFGVSQSASNEILREYNLYDFLEAIGTIGATEQKTDVPHSLYLYDIDQLPEDEVQEDAVVCLGGTRPISWTDKPKGDSLRHDFMGRAGMCSNTRECKIR